MQDVESRDSSAHEMLAEVVSMLKSLNRTLVEGSGKKTDPNATWGPVWEAVIRERRGRASLKTSLQRINILRQSGFGDDQLISEMNESKAVAIVEGLKNKNVLKREGRSVPISQGTMNRYLCLVSLATKYATRMGYMAEPFKLKRKEERKNFGRALETDEFQRLLACAPEHFKVLITVAVGTGMRRANLLGLTWRQVDLKRRMIHIPAESSKSGKPLDIPIADPVLEALQSQRGKHPERVFTFRGKPFNSINQRVWKRVTGQAGLEGFRFHDLRHTFATWLAWNGMSSIQIQHLGCWQSASMVNRYVKNSVPHYFDDFNAAISLSLRRRHDAP